MRRSTRKSSIGLLVEESRNPTGNFSTRFSLPSFLKRVEKLTDEQRNVIKKLGFGNLLLLTNQMLSKNLLVELMESWSCEESAFVLVPGMLKITSVDVALILGLRMVGDPLILKEDEPFSELEREYGAALWKRKIAVSALETRLESIGDEVNEDFIRTFILFMIGTILFPNTSGKVDSRYLSLLDDLDNIGRFSWGAAVLEDLIMWLNKRKETSVQYIGGCLILLQVWSYEHIDLARPALVESSLTFPRACRWENVRSHQRQWFTSQFKELQEHQIIWELKPTSEELKFDIIKELLEAQNEREDSSGFEYLATGDSVKDDGLQDESNVNNASEVQEQEAAEVLVQQPLASQHLPEVKKECIGYLSPLRCSALHKVDLELSSQSQNSSMNLVQQEEEARVHVQQPLASQHLPGGKRESNGYLPTSCGSALHKVDLELSSRSQKSSMNFTIGNGNELIKRIQELEAENLELKKENGTLRMENGELRNQILLTDNFVARLEGLVMDDSYPL
ncbi:hypothetical protein SLE2022_314260 [Rubroshorea leprosula]